MVRLLPWVEQQPLYDKFNFERPSVEDQIDDEGAFVGAAVVPIFRCPSDGSPRIMNGRGGQSYVASNGSAARIDSPTCSCANPPPWNALAISPYDIRTNFSGPFTRMMVSTRFDDVLDGLSNTIFFGETIGECSIHAARGWVSSNNLQGFASTIIPINYNSCKKVGEAANNCERECNWNTETGFQIRHPGGANFLKAMVPLSSSANRSTCGSSNFA